MPNRSSKDINQLAATITQQIVSDDKIPEKNPSAGGATF
jgi:hypothetical protein